MKYYFQEINDILKELNIISNCISKADGRKSFLQLRRESMAYYKTTVKHFLYCGCTDAAMNTLMLDKDDVFYMATCFVCYQETLTKGVSLSHISKH